MKTMDARLIVTRRETTSEFPLNPLGTTIGRSYNGTVLPLIAGLAILSALSLLVGDCYRKYTAAIDLF